MKKHDPEAMVAISRYRNYFPTLPKDIRQEVYPYTDYTNYTDYTPYTRYTINPGKTTGNRIPAWMIRKIHKRTRPMMQAQPCIHYDVPGSARKALASAIGEIIGTYPSYQAAPSFAYIIGEYTLDRNGVLTGPRNSQLMLTLDQDGYRTK